MRTETSTILYSTREAKVRDTLITEAERVAALGGSFAVRQYWSGDWYEEWKITYPDGVESQTQSRLNDAAAHGK